MGNPFNYAEPVGDRSRFYGRASELMRIHSRIAAERPQSVSVVGPLRSGKSSLVNVLCDRSAQAEYLDEPERYLMLRLRLRYDTPATPQAFFQRVDSALRHEGHEGMTPSFDGFQELVKEQMSQQRRMILFLDDFGEVTRNPGFSLDFFSFMRSVANSNDVGYLTTSSAALQNLCHTQDIEESPFFNIFTTVNLEPLSDTDARLLVEAPARDAQAPFADEADWILQLGGRHPFLLQAAAGVAFEARSRGESLDPDRLCELAFEATRGYLEDFWRDLSEPQRQVLSAIQDNRRIEPRQRYAAEALEQRGVLQANGELDFQAGLVKRFVAAAGGRKGFFQRLFG